VREQIGALWIRFINQRSNDFTVYVLAQIAMRQLTQKLNFNFCVSVVATTYDIVRHCPVSSDVVRSVNAALATGHCGRGVFKLPLSADVYVTSPLLTE